jgi:hypothetical protein
MEFHTPTGLVDNQPKHNLAWSTRPEEKFNIKQQSFMKNNIYMHLSKNENSLQEDKSQSPAQLKAKLMDDWWQLPYEGTQHKIILSLYKVSRMLGSDILSCHNLHLFSHSHFYILILLT